MAQWIAEIFGSAPIVEFLNFAVVALGLLLALIHELREFNQHRATHLVCTELLRTPLSGASREDGKQLVRLQLCNSGLEEIRDPRIDVTIRGPRRLDVTPSIWPRTYPPLQDSLHYQSVITGDPCVVSLKLDYLNSFTKHRQEVLLELLCDKPVHSIQVRGGGPGWSLQFTSLEAIRNRRRRDTIAFSVAVLLALVYTTVGPVPTQVAPWQFVSIVVLAAFALYGFIAALMERFIPGEDALVLVSCEPTLTGRIILRWVIRVLLAGFLAILIYSAGVTF